jgi:hypothetical protein
LKQLAAQKLIDEGIIRTSSPATFFSNSDQRFASPWSFAGTQAQTVTNSTADYSSVIGLAAVLILVAVILIRR